MSKFEISKDELYDLYISQNMSSSEISEKFKVSIDCIKHRLSKFGIKKDKQRIVEKIKGSSLEKRKRTCLEKYGTEHPCKSLKVKEKIKDTSKNKYGVDYVFQSDIVKEKIIKSNIEKYGVKYPQQSKYIKDKSKKTCILKYGADNPMKSKEIQNKLKQTCKNKYGADNVFKLKEFQDKADKTMLKRYGVKNSSQSSSIKSKCKETCIERHGVPYFCMTDICKEANGFTISKINQRFSEKLNLFNIKHELEFNIGYFSFDIHILNTNVLLEINPTYTHNSTKNCWFKNYEKQPIELDYHYNKSKLAKNNNYHCIHIFDWDNEDKIINMLKPKQRIYARNCTIKEVSQKESNEFLDKYHLQNSLRINSINLGLYYLDELVEVMTFGKPRYNKNYEYELLRLCSHCDYLIIGGSERLFKHFTDKYKPKSIISYCDNAKFSGDVYKKLGFELKSYGKPTKHWYNEKNKKHITDNLLRQRGFDQLFKANYGKGTSNHDLMIENNFVEVYDCGQSTYTYNN